MHFYIFVIILLTAIRSFSFPDMIRHGYINCTACHASPAGGGILNSYGRSLSKELISTWSYNNEEQPFHGLLKDSKSQEGSDKVLFGGDVRYLNRKLNTSTTETNESFLMQSQFRMSIAYEKIRSFLSIGKIDNPKIKSEVRWVSPEFYLLWSIKDDVHFRMGRFEPIFGLRLPDHNLWVKAENQIVPWNEKDASEFIYEGESQFLSLASYQANASKEITQQFTGFTISFYQTVFEKYRLGFGLISTEGQNNRFKSYNFNATLPITEYGYFMFESSQVSQNGTVKNLGLLRSGYEIYKGLIPLLQYQTYSEVTDSNKTQNKSGVGFVFYPRPHFEFTTLLENLSGYRGNIKELQVLSHYYF